MDNRYLRILVYVLLVLYFSLFFLRKINLITADLGRHITNGKVFLKQGLVVSTNYYSYTQPDFSVVTHHWLSGVVFYLVHNLIGFTGLSIFYILISGLTVFVFFKIAEDRSNFPIALLFTILLIPLIANRKEIRPEGFSYLFMGIYYYLTTLYLKKKLKFKILATALLVLQLLWVNLHLFFVMGIAVVGAFTFFEALKKWIYKKKNKFKELLVLSAGLVIVSLINPYTLQGLLEPLNILKEYGYMIVENQSVLFMQKRSPGFEYIYFEMAALSVLFMTGHILLSKRVRSNAVPTMLLLAFLILAFRAIRGIPIFAMFYVPVAAGYIYNYYKGAREKLLWPAIFLIIITLIPGHVFSFSQPSAGLGLVEDINNSAEFMKQTGIKGPLFNNYDIGGYLIYHFNDQEKVFVDNRPEAYTVEFFTELYGPMQEKPEIWQEAQEEYNFNSIYFYRRDRTQWAQPFLIERIKDPEWIPVYVDLYVLILVKNNEQNQDIINNYKIPNNVFVVT